MRWAEGREELSGPLAGKSRRENSDGPVGFWCWADRLGKAERAGSAVASCCAVELSPRGEREEEGREVVGWATVGAWARPA